MSLFVYFELLIYILSAINAQITPSYDKLCVSESTHISVDGTYSNPKWHSDLNGATYYNEKTSQYLFPYVTTGGYRYFMIALNPIFTTITSLTRYCAIGSKPTDYIFNIVDCFNQWKYSLNGKEIHDTNMTVVNCNDIRVTGNQVSWFNGIYVWKMFINNYSLYYCNECSSYLRGWVHSDGAYWWLLTTSYNDGSATSYCYLGSNLDSDYVFNLDECLYWKTYNDTHWNIDEDLVVKERVPCDSNALTEHCLYVDMYPSQTLPTSNTVQIQNTNDESHTYFYIFFMVHDLNCIHPKVSFKFERIDTDASSEYIHVINHNGSLIAKCGGATPNKCGVFEECFHDISIDVNEIEINQTYQILIIESPHIDALCKEHKYSINGQLSLACAVATITDNSTITSTENPTTTSTIYPTTTSYTSSSNLTLFTTTHSTTNGHIEEIENPSKISCIKTHLIIAVCVVLVLCIIVIITFRHRLFSKYLNVAHTDVEDQPDEHNSNSINRDEPSNSELHHMIPVDGLISSTGNADIMAETAFI